jgi:hypothetical protein
MPGLGTGCRTGTYIEADPGEKIVTSLADNGESSDRMKEDPPAVPVSVCIVAHNEEMNIARAIDSVSGWAREVIVLDCESRDRTAELARQRGVIVHEAPNLVPEANKNRAFEYATEPWIFILDADEIMSEPLKAEVARVISAEPVESGFKIPRRNFYFGTPLMHGGNYPDRQLRLFRRGHGRYPGVGYHERLQIEGEIGSLSSSFDHHPYPTFEIWLSEFDRYTRFGAASLVERRMPITPSTIRKQMITRPLRRWLERLFVKQGIRDGVPGVLAATFDLMTNVVSFGRYWMEERRVGEGETTGRAGRRDDGRWR